MNKANSKWESANGLLRLDECIALWPGLEYERLKKWTQRGILSVAAKQGRRVYVNKRDVEAVLSERSTRITDLTTEWNGEKEDG